MSILYWNTVALEVQRRDFTPGNTGDLGNTDAFAPEQGGPTRTSRALAIIHIAMYDAVATISGLTTYSSGHAIALPALPANADVQGAIAGAASATLQALWKAKPQTEFVQGQLQDARNLAEASGVTADAFETGMHFGAAVGRAILAARANDGNSALDDMCFSQLPYRHRADPYNPTQGRLSVYWGEVQPFCIAPAGAGARIDTRYLGAHPNPGTQAERYEAAVLDVNALGSAFGSTRTADETVNGIFWGYDGPPGLGVPPRLYNQVVRKAIDAHCPGIGVPELASLLAMVNVGMADAAIVAWSAKYHYDLWRPVVGIREHDLGFGPNHGGSAGVANPQYSDPSWAPLGAPRTNVAPGQFHRTPDFPAYPSGHATFGAVAFRLTALFLATKLGLATTGDGTSRIGRRDYAMARCLADLGLRSQEVAALRLEDIDWRGGILHLAPGKSRRAAQLPLPQPTGAALADYLRHGRPKTPSRAVFVQHRAPVGAAVAKTTVRGAIRRAFGRAALPWSGTHILRHTAAASMVRGGSSLKLVADVLRHRSIDTTAIYTKVDLPELVRVALPWPGRLP